MPRHTVLPLLRGKSNFELRTHARVLKVNPYLRAFPGARLNAARP